MKHESRCNEGSCLFNPLGLAIECLNCRLYPKTEKEKQEEQELFVIQPDEDGVTQCPYYGGECLVMYGTGAIGEWCIRCNSTDPDKLFPPSKRKMRREARARDADNGRKCESCGKFFIAMQDHQRFCSVKCRKREKFKRYNARKKEQKAAMIAKGQATA